VGAWGIGPFENDDAADWAFEFSNADLPAGLRIITSALQSAAEVASSDYLDSDLGVPALAAADIVALINGQTIEVSSYNEAPRNWVNRYRPTPDAALTLLARRAVERVGQAPSELVELWAEVGDEDWRASLAQQLSKLDAQNVPLPQPASTPPGDQANPPRRPRWPFRR
jgi:hypothetical protein